MDTKKAVLIEFIDEADCLISYCNQHRIDVNSILIVALSTKVQAYLNKKNIRYSTTLEYFKNSAQESIIKKNEEIISCFLKNLSGSVSLIEDSILYIRVFIFHYLWIIEILNNLKKERFCSMILIKSRSQVNSSLIINECERYAALFCQKFCIENHIEYTIIENDSSLFCNYAKPNKFLQKICRILAALNLNRVSKSKSSTIFVYNLSYNFDKLFNQILNNHPGTRCIVLGEMDVSPKLLIALFLQLFNISYRTNVVYLPVNVFTDKKLNPDMFLTAINNSFNEDIFHYHGISFKEELREKVMISLFPHLGILNNQKEIVDSIYEKIKPRLVLSQIGIGLGRVIGEISLKQNVPSIFISHGSHKTPTNEIEYIELFNLCKGFMLSEFTYAAISSPFAKKHFDYFKLHYPRMPAQPLISGNLIYSKLDYAKKPGIYKEESEKIILHATTLKSRGADRFYFMETNDEFFSAVNDLIEVVNGMNNVKLLLRFHPGYPLSEEEIRSLLKPSDKLLISLSGPFQDVLAVSDILVSYSSTAIEESLLNFIPVVLYDKWNRYNHLDAPEFNDATEDACAYYATNKNDLKKSINRLLQPGKIINKDCYYRYIYKDDFNPHFYDFISKLFSDDKT